MIDLNAPEYRQATEESYTRFNNAEIEQAVLNLVLLDNDLLPNISDKISLLDFAYQINREIFSVMQDLYSKKISIDILSLNESVAFNDPVYVSGLTSILSSSSNWEFYINQILDLSALRKTDVLKRTVLKDLTPQNIRENLELASKELLEISIDSSSFKIKTPSEIMPSMLKDIDDARNRPPGLSGFDWGLEELNKITDGIQNEFIIIGARPSKGKTALALKIINTLCNNKIPTGFFTLETTEKSIFMRFLSIDSHIPSKNIRSGAFAQHQYTKIFKSSEKINDWPLFILDDIYYLEDIKSRARYMVRTLGVKIIFIDYFGKIMSRQKFGQRHETFAFISSELANLRKELKVPIVLLSQVRRDVENKAPGLDSLGETKALEQDGDTIIFINQDRGSLKKISIVDLIIGKQRDGPTGTIQVGYIPSYTEFVNLEKNESGEEKQQTGFYDSMVEKEKEE